MSDFEDDDDGDNNAANERGQAPHVAIVGDSHFTDYRQFLDEITTMFFAGEWIERKTGRRASVGFAARPRSASARAFRCTSLVTGVSRGTDALVAQFAHDALLPCTRIAPHRSNVRQHARKLLVNAHVVVLFYSLVTRNVAALLETIDEFDLPALVYHTQTRERKFVRCGLLSLSPGIAIEEPFFYVLAAPNLVFTDSSARTKWIRETSINESSETIKFVCCVRFASAEEFDAHAVEGFASVALAWQHAMRDFYEVGTPLTVIDEVCDRQYQNDDDVVVFNLDAPEILPPITTSE
jgi:hypothetical protein